ncbi:MAG: HAD family hydrolase [Bdellovibrionales bacterium]
MNNRKFIVWDWNGTLLDDTEIVLDCINIALAKIGSAPISMEVLRNTQSTPFETLFCELGVAREKMDILIKNNNIFHDSYERRADHAPLRKGASSLLKQLKANNISNFIVSNHIADQIIRLLKRNSIYEFFDEVMAYATPAVQFCGKTKGERLHDYIRAKELDASKALIVGDTREEIRIAHELGMKSVAITGGILAEDLLRAEKPDYIVHSFDDLSSLLKEREYVS